MFLNLFEQNSIEVKENIQLKDYSNFKVGGLCKALALPKTDDEIIKIIKILKSENIKYMVLGKGANVLFSDEGYDGVIIKLASNFSFIKVIGDTIVCDTGVSLSKLCKTALEHSLSGLAFAFGIPGTVGGAVYMNAGAYGGEMKDVVKKVTYIDENANVQKITNGDLDFNYRHSFFSDKGLVITNVTFQLQKGDQNEIKRTMDELFNKRVSKQPYNKPSAGSTFKRPLGNYASKLIDECGLKGKTVGGAMVSDLHAGFIINDNNATSKDILNLINLVKKEVEDKTGYTLECEVKIIEK